MLVVSLTDPTRILGRIAPLGDVPGLARISGEYQIHLDQYPDLQSVGGSVRLISDSELELNPDHLDWAYLPLRLETQSLPCKRGWYPIALTRIKEVGTDAFTAVSTFCPHEAEYQVNFDPLRFIFVCCHQESSFRPDGMWIPPDDPDAANPDAPDTGTVKRGLRRFQALFDGDNTISIRLDTGDAPASRAAVAALGQNHPNPCHSRTVIPFSLAHDCTVLLEVYNAAGELVSTRPDLAGNPGENSIELDISGLAPGDYIYRLTAQRIVLSRRMVII